MKSGKRKPFKMTTPKRSNAARDTQLSKDQRQILLWLLTQEEMIKSSGDKKQVVELNQKGIPWKPKRFYDDMFREAMPRSKASSISTSLKALEDSENTKIPRHLVQRFDVAGGIGKKPRTSHVKLTAEGRHAAHFEREHGMTKRRYKKLEKMGRQLEHYRYCLTEFNEAIRFIYEDHGPYEVRDPWDWRYTIVVGSREFDQKYQGLLVAIGGLAKALDIPLTDEERLLLENVSYRNPDVLK